MSKQRLASIIANLHFAWILLGVVNLPLLFFVSWWNRIALVFVGLTTSSWLLFKGKCILTKLESWLRGSIPDNYPEEEFLLKYINKKITIFFPVKLWRRFLWGYLVLLLVLAL